MFSCTAFTKQGTSVGRLFFCLFHKKPSLLVGCQESNNYESVGHLVRASELYFQQRKFKAWSKEKGVDWYYVENNSIATI